MNAAYRLRPSLEGSTWPHSFVSVTSERLMLALNDLIGADIRINIADAPSGWAMASLAGPMAGVDVDDDQLMIRIGDGATASWVVLYFDMVERVLTGDIELEIIYEAGDITISRVHATPV